MTKHEYKSRHPRCRCLWCGSDRPWHERHDCPVSNDLKARIAGFARAAGRTWKTQLCRLWESGGDSNDAELRQARNIIGPYGLDRITPQMIQKIVTALS